MPNYTLTSADASPRSWESQKGGPMLSYKVNVKGDDGFEGIVEIAQKDSTPAPTSGQTIEGTLDKSNPKYPPKLKKAMGGGFGGGGAPRGKSPDERHSIERQTAYKGAVELVNRWEPTGGTEVEKVKAMLTELFNHSLSLIQGTPPIVHSEAGHDTKKVSKDHSAPPADSGPSVADLRAAYKHWSGNDPDASNVFANKLTTLGIVSVDDATAEQRQDLVEFLT